MKHIATCREFYKTSHLQWKWSICKHYPGYTAWITTADGSRGGAVIAICKYGYSLMGRDHQTILIKSNIVFLKISHQTLKAGNSVPLNQPQVILRKHHQMSVFIHNGIIRLDDQFKKKKKKQTRSAIPTKDLITVELYCTSTIKTRSCEKDFPFSRQCFCIFLIKHILI